MPRKPQRKGREKWTINDWRGHNYMVHFDKRKYIEALPETMVDQYRRAGEILPYPKLNIWGVGEFTWEQERVIFAVNVRFQLDVWYLNPWYCTSAGWDDFQEKWKALPELVESPCIPIADLVAKEREKAQKKLYT